MRESVEVLDDDDFQLVHISVQLAEAKRVERLLCAENIRYVVNPEKYRATFLFVFSTERVGAFFYVRTEEVDRCRALLSSQGFSVTD